MPATETILDAPAGIAVFYSAKHHNLKVIRRPAVESVTAVGIELVGPEVSFQFTDNVLRIDTEDPKANMVLPDGPRDAEQDAVSYLMGHSEYGTTFVRSGFEPDRPLPTENDYLDAVTDAVLVGDYDALVKLKSDEEESHGRTVLIHAAENGIAKLEAIDAAGQGTPKPKPKPKAADE